MTEDLQPDHPEMFWWHTWEALVELGVVVVEGVVVEEVVLYLEGPQL